METFTIDPEVEAKLIRLWQLITQVQAWHVLRPIPTLEERAADWGGPDHDRQMTFACEAMKTYIIDCLMMGGPTLDLVGLVNSLEELEGDPEGVADALLTELNDALIGLSATARSGDFAAFYERMRPRVHLVHTLLRLIPTPDLDPVQQFEQTKAIITQTEARAQEVGEW